MPQCPIAGDATACIVFRQCLVVIQAVMFFTRVIMQLFCSCDLDLDPMALIHELDVDTLKIYVHIENELSRSMVSKIGALQIHNRCDRNHYHAAGAKDVQFIATDIVINSGYIYGCTCTAEVG